MKQLGDKLVDSPICDSNACYESEFQTQEGVVKTIPLIIKRIIMCNPIYRKFGKKWQ